MCVCVCVCVCVFVCVKRSLPIRSILRFSALDGSMVCAAISRLRNIPCPILPMRILAINNRNQISRIDHQLAFIPCTFSNSSYYDRRYLLRIKVHYYNINILFLFDMFFPHIILYVNIINTCSKLVMQSRRHHDAVVFRNVILNTIIETQCP